MASESPKHSPSKHEIYDESLSGAIDPPLIPKLRSDPHVQTTLPQTLEEFREQEGKEYRKRRLHAVWHHICESGYLTGSHHKTRKDPDLERAEKLRAEYENELLGRCVKRGSTSIGHSTRKPLDWNEFKAYAEAKEAGAQRVERLCLQLLTLFFRALDNISQ